jgi:hypothetical protein
VPLLDRLALSPIQQSVVAFGASAHLHAKRLKVPWIIIGKS